MHEGKKHKIFTLRFPSTNCWTILVSFINRIPIAKHVSYLLSIILMLHLNTRDNWGTQTLLGPLAVFCLFFSNKRKPSFHKKLLVLLILYRLGLHIYVYVYVCMYINTHTHIYTHNTQMRYILVRNITKISSSSRTSTKNT